MLCVVLDGTMWAFIAYRLLALFDLAEMNEYAGIVMPAVIDQVNHTRIEA